MTTEEHPSHVRRLLAATFTRRAVRLFSWFVSGIGVLLAVVLVTSITVDLGPSLRHLAEREGSKRVHRPMHIGRLSVRLFTGQFVLDNLVIEGVTPADRPFLKAGRLSVTMSWSGLIHREVLVDSIEMTDWQMVVETFANARHTFPKLTSDGPAGPKLFTTTMRYIRASRGQFTFEDHVVPWSAVARNLDVTVARLADYRGQASFHGGTIQIQNYQPMTAEMRASFRVDGGKVKFSRIDLTTDGTRSVMTGEDDLAHWPEQIYRVNSRVEFPKMRDVFFHRQHFTLAGEGQFEGTFHVYKGGRELKGTFSSENAAVNDFLFPALHGSLVWLPDRFEVARATSKFYGGTTSFTYSMSPLGAPTPAIARLDATYQDVDLAQFSDFMSTAGIRLTGRASGSNLLEWPLGRFEQHSGHGHVIASPPDDQKVLERPAPGTLARESPDLQSGPEWGPFSKVPLVERVPLAADMTYAYGPEWLELSPSRFATSKTYVEFQGRTAYGDRSRIPFHVSSADWQESDRVLAGILTAFGSPASAVPIGGYGRFDGVMLGAFRSPRVEGTFSGESMTAWRVNWGSGQADIALENGYLDVTDGLIRKDDSEIHALGRFALGYPRRDGGEEVNARIRIVKREVADLRRAFNLDDYKVSGRLTGEFHIYGKYETPFGFGKMTIEPGVAYGEAFDTIEGSLRFEGPGVRLDAVQARKSGGTLTGAAFVGWNGTYSFNADARRIPMETMQSVAYPKAPLSGLMEFTASGSGSFDVPRYDVRVHIQDLFVADEGVGDVTGRIGVRGDLMTLEVEAASPRLVASGTGRISLNPEADAELTLRFTDTSLDPYVRTFVPELSPFTTAVASGTIRVVGELADVDHLLVDGTVEQLRLGLFDYQIQNANPIRLSLDRHTVKVERMRLIGEGTELDVSGDIALHDGRIALRTTGNANLGILQGFFRDLRSAGQAQLVAAVDGPLDNPLLSGSATIAGGRLRHFALPHSLESINGRVTFDARAIRFDELTAKVGGGDVQFGGRVGLQGYKPGDLNVTAVGTNMRLRYPEGVTSLVDADLSLRGSFDAPLLTGTVTVKDAVWTKRIDTSGNLFELVGASAASSTAAAGPTTLPARFDIRLIAPSTLRVENNAARIVMSADLTLRGTYDRPTLFGRVEVDHGEVTFEAKRYVVTRGSIDFSNPARIDPFFDIEAETRVRVPGQTYRVTLRSAGTRDRLNMELSSDPPLSQIDILSLLFGDVRPSGDVEVNALRDQSLAEQQLLQARAARLLASPISSEVGRVVEQSFGVDTFQITPSLVDPYQQSSRLNPSARLTIGKRISERLYLTFARSLTSSNRDQVILLEYDQSDRLSWILTQNEDKTYSLDLRVRHTF